MEFHIIVPGMTREQADFLWALMEKVVEWFGLKAGGGAHVISDEETA